MKNVRTNVARLLEAAGIVCVEHRYDIADGAIDAVSVARKLGEPVEQVFKTLVTVGASRNHYVFVIPVMRELDLKKAAKAAGEKSVAMIRQKDLLPLTGYVHGGCSPVGMKKAFPTFIHESAEKEDQIFVSAGKVGFQVGVNPKDLSVLVRFAWADLTAGG